MSIRGTVLVRWYTNTAIILLTIALLFLMVNAVLGLIFHLGERGERTLPTPDQEHELSKAYPGWTAEQIHTLLVETWGDNSPKGFQLRPFRLWAEEPFRGKYVNIDAAGFRRLKNQSQWPPRREDFTTFVFGSSNTFGYGLSDGEAIPSVLQDLAMADCGPHTATYNFGRAGFSSTTEAFLFYSLLRSGAVPDLAIFIDGFSEGFDTGSAQESPTTSAQTSGDVVRNFIRLLPITQAATKLKNRIQTEVAPVARDPLPSAETVVDRWLANRAMIEALGRHYGVRTFFVWQPIPIYKYELQYHVLHRDFLTPNQKKDAPYLLGLQVYLNMAGNRQSLEQAKNFLWLADIQEGRKENLYVDAEHYSARFASEVAGHIYQAARERDLWLCSKR